MNNKNGVTYTDIEKHLNEVLKDCRSENNRPYNGIQEWRSNKSRGVITVRLSKQEKEYALRQNLSHPDSMPFTNQEKLVHFARKKKAREGNEHKIIREQECHELTTISRTTRWRLEKLNKFPKRLKLTNKSIGWREQEVLDWLYERGAQS